MSQTLRLVRKKVSELKFAPYNPRKASKKVLKQLKQSIEEFGYRKLARKHIPFMGS